MHFSGFAKAEVSPYSLPKIVTLRDHLYSVLLFLLEEWTTSLVYLAAVTWNNKSKGETVYLVVK